jgi:hypothetical protein
MHPNDASNAILVVALPGLLHSARVDLGSIPDWIAGIGTVAAFFVALLLFRRQMNELRDADEGRQRAQATQISAWCKEETQSDGSAAQWLRLRNGSGEPVYQCAALFASANNETWTAQNHDEWQAAINRSGASYGARGTMVLAPGETTNWVVEDTELQSARGAIVPVFLIFRDAHGTSWSRSPRGVLLRFDSPVINDQQMLALMTRF